MTHSEHDTAKTTEAPKQWTGTEAAEPAVIAEVRSRIGVITLNRAKKINALNQLVRSELQVSAEGFDADPDVDVIVVTGSGGNFSAGRDLTEAAAGLPIYPDEQSRQHAFTRQPPTKPVIAAIEGYALAGGFELALACDIIVASKEAVFGLPEASRGLVAVGGALLRLPRRMPYHAAMHMALTGRRVTSAQLQSWGIVSEITTPGEALDGALSLAGDIAANGQAAVRATKEIISRALYLSSEADGFDVQETIAAPTRDSEERKKGIVDFADSTDDA